MLTAICYWPVARIRPVPAGLELDVTESTPAPAPLAEPTGLEQALAVIPPELRSAPAPGEPPARAPMVPDPRVEGPAQAARWVPALPEIQGRAPVTGGGGAVKVKAGPAKEGRPIALFEILPQYPYGARVRGESGRVTVQVVVNARGTVDAAQVVSGSGHPALDASAVAATKAARFKPAEQDGKPVSSGMNLQFEFRLEER